jgi:hypothetical protein
MLLVFLAADMNKLKFATLGVFLGILFLSMPALGTAQAAAVDSGAKVTLPDYTGTSQGGTDVISDIQKRLGKMLATAFQALAVLSLLPIAVGGIQLITSQGNANQVDKGKKTLFWGVVGLVLALSGVAIFTVLLNVLTTR